MAARPMSSGGGDEMFLTIKSPFPQQAYLVILLLLVSAAYSELVVGAS